MKIKVWTLMLPCALIWHAGFAEKPKVEVFVVKKYEIGKIVYSYSITNNGDQAIWRVMIGFSESPETGFLGVKPAAIRSPLGWNGESLWCEASDSETYLVEWKQDDAQTANLIKPGESLGGFLLDVPGETTGYTNSPFVVRFVNREKFQGVSVETTVEPKKNKAVFKKNKLGKSN